MVKRLVPGILCSKYREVIIVGKPMIMLSSITYAMKSRDILFQYNIKSYIERTQYGTANSGCGYSIYVPNKTDEAEKILTDLGIKVLGRSERDGTV
jgi:hypothetical protein